MLIKYRKYLPYILLVLAVVVNFAGINNGFFTNDPALYGSIAKNMLWHNNYTGLFTYNQDWLDKPHFPFWCIAVSFKLFGISECAYRLPALLFFLLSLLYTGLFTKKYYGPETALNAVLVLATALNVIMANTDVRAEPYLMGLLTGAIYHITNINDRPRFTDIVLAALFTACAIMTKGIFVIVPVYGSLLIQSLFTGRLKTLLRLKWLLLVLLTILLILPELYSLYIQFDLHPEKNVFGINNVSGIKWFLWDSQFGRFVNNGPIRHQATGSIFFYLHTLLWAFAPWCLLFYLAVYKQVKAIAAKRSLPEYYAAGGGLLLLLLFSLSRFQLPFYTNAVFPLFAILTAGIVIASLPARASIFRKAGMLVFIIALPAAVLFLDISAKPERQGWFIICCLLLIFLVSVIVLNIRDKRKRLFYLACSTAICAGLFLNTVFFPLLSFYNGQKLAAQYANLGPFRFFNIYTLNRYDDAFQFYCNKPVTPLPAERFNDEQLKGPALFYARQATLNYLDSAHVTYHVVRSFINYPQENILPKFINPASRPQVLNRVYLVSR